jgi:hypothetical protein
MEEFWITLLSIMAGAVGYLIATFWVRPILRYRDIKSQVASDLVCFANAIELQKLDGSFREDTLQRKDANRRRAAELKAVYFELPHWYRLWLKCRGENLGEASSELIGLSNSSSRDEAKDYIQKVKDYLRLPLERP